MAPLQCCVGLGKSRYSISMGGGGGVVNENYTREILFYYNYFNLSNYCTGTSLLVIII